MWTSLVTPLYATRDLQTRLLILGARDEVAWLRRQQFLDVCGFGSASVGWGLFCYDFDPALAGRRVAVLQRQQLVPSKTSLDTTHCPKQMELHDPVCVPPWASLQNAAKCMADFRTPSTNFFQLIVDHHN